MTINLVVDVTAGTVEVSGETFRPAGKGVRMATGDVFESFYREHYERVYGYVARRLADPAIVEEVCAECFVTAWSKFDPAAPFSVTWLYRTAHNHIGNAYQRRQKDQQLLALLRAQATIGSSPCEIDLVAEAMAKLGETDREALRLTYWEELSAAEVAVVLGCSERAAWKRISRARTALRQTINRYNQEHGGV